MSITRVVAFGLGVAALTAACLHVGHGVTFFGLEFYDDEGYLLLSLRQYAHGAALYDQVYSQYGPAYFAILHGASWLFRIPFTHTVSRDFTLGSWLGSSILCGLTTYRLTGSAVTALMSQVLVFEDLAPIGSEPMHPGGLLCLILSATALVGTFVGGRHGTVAAATLGGLVATAAGVKINVGSLALVSATYAVAAAAGRAGRPLALLAAIGMVIVAPALTVSGWAQAWVRGLVALVAGSAAAVAITGFTNAHDLRVRRRDVLVMLVGFTLTTAVFCTVPLARGTSAGGLLHGVILDPLRHPNLFTVPAVLPPRALLWSVAAVAAAGLVAAGRSRWATASRAGLVLGAIHWLAGIAIWWGGLVGGFAAALPLLWIALLAPATGVPARQRRAGELVLVALAVLQVLHAYPVAGSHKAWATFLFVPVGALAIVHGIETVCAQWPRRRLHLRRALLATTLGITLVSPTFRAVLIRSKGVGMLPAMTVPLALPGTDGIRVLPAQADAFQRVTQELTEHCRSLITMPGLNSFYLFTGLEPPTSMNVGAWPILFGPETQLWIRDRFATAPAPRCAVRYRDLVSWWTNRCPGRGTLDEPLVRYIDERFVTVDQHLGYEVMHERGEAREQAANHPHTDRAASSRMTPAVNDRGR